MLDSVGRVVKDRMLTPVIAAIPTAVSPTAITITSLVPGIASAWAASQSAWGVALGLFIANRILDGLDGLVARRRNSSSDLGGYLDILVDFVVYAVIPIGAWVGAAPVFGPRWIGASTAAGARVAAGTAGTAGTAASPWPLIALLAVFYVNAASWMYLSAVIEKRRSTERAGTPRAGADHPRPDDTVESPREPLSTQRSGGTTVVMPTGVIEGTETLIFYVLFLLFPRYLPQLFLAMAMLTAVGIAGRVAWAWRRL